MIGLGKDIKLIDLEATTVCNAKCPQCSREDSSLYNDSTDRAELTLEKCKQVFTPEIIKNLDKMFMCGTFGDPAANPDTLEIFKYFREINPNITLGMNTNGSIRSTSWWTQIGELFTKMEDYVVFSLDGLEDTNHIYRIGVNFNKAMQNAEAFIKASGNAHWDMLVFAHNEHQIEEAEQLAKSKGFKWFRCKVSKRFVTKPVEGLDPPLHFNLPNIKESEYISCKAVREKSVYVSAKGIVYPCSWIGSLENNNIDDYLSELLDSKNWNKLKNSWSDKPHEVCKKSCGKSNGKSSYENQWTREVEF